MSEQVTEQAERALLSAILNFNDAILVASEHVKSQHFSNPDYCRIYKACLGVDRHGIPVDIVNVGRVLGDGSGLLATMTGLLAVHSNQASIQHYAEIIREDYLKRSALQITKGLSDRSTGSEVIVEIERKLSDLESDMVTGDEDDRLFGAGNPEEILFPSPDDSNGSTLYPSGITELDNIIGGFETGTVTALQGLFKSGKSKLLIQVLVHNAKVGVPVGFITLDMPRRRVERWIASHHCRIDSRFFKNPNTREWDSGREEFRQQVRESNVGTLPILVTERQKPSVYEIGAVIARWARRGVRLVGIDYFEGMDTGSEWKEEGKVTGGLNNIAVKHDVALIYVDQLNKSAEEANGPNLRHSRGSVIRCADADTILQIGNAMSRDRDDSTQPDKIADIDMLIVERDGVSGKIIKLRADLSIGQFAGREDRV